MAIVSFIVLNYKTPEITKRCIECILQNVQLAGKKEVIIWDNASRDGSGEYLQRYFSNQSSVQVVLSETNLGFGMGVNRAAEKATGEFLCLVNSDVFFERLDIDVLLEQFQQAKNIGFLSTKILYSDGKIQSVSVPYPSVKSAIHQFVFFRDYHVMSPITYAFHKDVGLRKSDWVSGCVMLCRKSMFEEIGGFDENIFMYNEDLDICARVNKKYGYQNYVYDKEFVYHLHGASTQTNKDLENKLLKNAKVYKEVIERNNISKYSDLI